MVSLPLFISCSFNEQTFTGHIVDVSNRCVFDGKVVVKDGRIDQIVKCQEVPADAPYFMPGFIDSHVHVESSMLIPSEFAGYVIPHGTVGAVSDPHEIANVLGIEGVRFMLDNASASNFNFCFGAPSCVPSCGSDIETGGAVLSSEEVAQLLDMPEIGYLSEMMNFPGVLNKDPEVLKKIEYAQKIGKRIDGHAPGLVGEARAKYAAAGISSDHECTTLEEGLSCVENGMSVLIREGSAAKNFDTLAPIIATAPDQVMFCSDDIHPGDLNSGHIDALVRRALAKGYDLWSVLRAATFNPQIHYGLDWGLLREGDPATFILVDSLSASMKVLDTYINGLKATEQKHVAVGRFPNCFKAKRISAKDIRDSLAGPVRTIVAFDGQLYTSECEADRNDPEVQKIVVINRYQEGAEPAIGFVKGFGLNKGAMATSIAHDCHNIVAIGGSDEEIVRVVNKVVAMKGGIAASYGVRLESLALPIAGIMSPLDASAVADANERLLNVISDAGCRMTSPLITMSFMCLPVIPQLKITDKGLVSL